jgi:hypothetical protein
MHAGSFTGSPFAHPNAEMIGLKRGYLSQQAMDLRNDVGALRMGIKSRDVGYVPIQDEIDLVVDDGTIVRGTRVIEGTSVNPKSSDVRFLMARREDDRLYWTMVNISQDTIAATLYRNPVDEQLTVDPPT